MGYFYLYPGVLILFSDGEKCNLSVCDVLILAMVLRVDIRVDILKMHLTIFIENYRIFCRDFLLSHVIDY